MTLAEIYLHPNACSLFDCMVGSCSCGIMPFLEKWQKSPSAAEAWATEALGMEIAGGGYVRQLRSVQKRRDVLEFHFLVEDSGNRAWRPPVHGRAGRDKQARFREFSRTISDAGRSPDDDVGQRNPYLLTQGHGQENLFPPLRPRGRAAGPASQFFSERGMSFWLDTGRTRDRKPGAGEATVPTRNMASSQVSCVNLLLPLAEHPKALAAAIRTIDPDLGEVLPIKHEGRRSFVELEWVGTDESLEGTRGTRGALTTSVDAFVIGRARGGICAYLLEWKYVEEGGDQDRGSGTAGDRRRKRYQSLFEQSGLFKVDFESVLHEPIYQLMRFALLGHRTMVRKELDVTDFRIAVVCPPGNKAYRRLETSNSQRLSGYGDLETAMQLAVLRSEHAHRFSMATQTQMVMAALAAEPTALVDWGDYLAERYGW